MKNRNTTIWKFPMQLTEEQEVELPEGAEILSVKMQHSNPCIWASVNPESPKQPRVFAIAVTGGKTPDREAKFLATLEQGPWVFHVFEITKP